MKTLHLPQISNRTVENFFELFIGTLILGLSLAACMTAVIMTIAA